MRQSGLLPLLIALAMTASAVSAATYKWKDKHGKWHFSDRPPPGQVVPAPEPAPEPAAANERRPRATGQDLADKLEQQFSPRNAIEVATLAVVTIKMPNGPGSGFFISSSGHVLTIRDVVRPTTSTGFKDIAAEVEDLRVLYKNAEREMKKERAVLARHEKDLASLKKRIAAETISTRRRDLQSEYDNDKHHYDQLKDIYLEVKRDYRKARSAFESARTDLSVKSSRSKLRRSFALVLKDGSEIRARVLRISHDLALLKIDGYVTPMLQVANFANVAQGTRVFAIGTPLGTRTSVSSGVVSGVRMGTVETDTQILPGNSGGPLINENGKVLGIITATLSQSASSQGVGIALRFDRAIRQFDAELN